MALDKSLGRFAVQLYWRTEQSTVTYSMYGNVTNYRVTVILTKFLRVERVFRLPLVILLFLAGASISCLAMERSIHKNHIQKFGNVLN